MHLTNDANDANSTITISSSILKWRVYFELTICEKSIMHQGIDISHTISIRYI